MVTTRTGGVLLGLFAVAAAGCDYFRAYPFSGSYIQLTVSGARPTAAGHHLELWARDGQSSIIRLLATPPDVVLGGNGQTQDSETSPQGLAPGQVAYQIVQAVDGNDPCMIDAQGNLLTSPDAIRPDETEPQGDLGAKSVLQRIDQLTNEGAVLFALVGYDDNTPNKPVLDPMATTPAMRLMACNGYWTAQANQAKNLPAASPGAAYTGNPLQLTAPVHGELFGMLNFQAVPPAPSQILGGIQVVSNFALHDLREIWLTDTAATVSALDPTVTDCTGKGSATCRGDVILQGNAGAPDNGVFRMELTSPSGASVSGSAAVYTRLDEDPVQL